MNAENTTIVSCFRWGCTTMIMTGIGLAILVWSIIIMFQTMIETKFDIIIGGITIAILILIYLFTFCYAPRYLSIDNQKITLKRMVGSFEIPLTTICSIQVIPRAMLRRSIRCGNGGLFGFYGFFSNKTIGSYTMYATELKHLIMVKTTRKTYVFSCRKGEAFKTFFDNCKK